MDLEVFFHVSSPGYEYPKDMFNNSGLKLKTTRGGSAKIQLKRMNIAERLYRITGQGIYRDSLLVGRPVSLKRPVLNGQVMGQDTVIAAPYRGKIYWFWGDTDRPSYPLGNFGASGATSELPAHGGLDPALGVDLSYFVDESGFSKPMCPLPKGGLHWIESLFTVSDQRGNERLIARMANVPGLADATDWHLLMFNDEKEVFESIRDWEIHLGHESAHPFRARSDGITHYYIFTDYRVPADLESLGELERYEAFTCISGDGKWHGPDTKVDRDASGRVRFTWKAGADRLRGQAVEKLVKSGQLKSHEADGPVLDFETGDTLNRRIDTVAWNSFRRRWIALFADRPGGVCFAEADTPLGPWGYGRRIATHGNYNFYNIAHHSFFDQDDGRLIYFEGTYTDSFSDAREKTPRYNYNQLMYRLALDDPRLVLPVAVYRLRGTNGVTTFLLRDQVEATKASPEIAEVEWFGLPRKNADKDLMPIYLGGSGGNALSLTPPAPGEPALFFGVALGGQKSTNPLEGPWQFRADDDFKFLLDLSLDGEKVSVSDTTSSGSFHEDKLTLVLRVEDGQYRLEGRLNKGTLNGSWRKVDGAEKGTWSASPAPTNSGERHSLTLLKEYHRLSDGRSEYSIQPGPPEDCESTGRPLCRVWKVPSQQLTLDWKIKSAP
jgi:hypothetical protein